MSGFARYADGEPTPADLLPLASTVSSLVGAALDDVFTDLPADP